MEQLDRQPTAPWLANELFCWFALEPRHQCRGRSNCWIREAVSGTKLNCHAGDLGVYCLKGRSRNSLAPRPRVLILSPAKLFVGLYLSPNNW